MRYGMKRLWIAIAAGTLAGGCGLLPDADSGCDKAKPYEAAQQQPPLRVPTGADLPDTRNALSIPELKAPQLPVEPGRCLDHPPSYGASKPRSS